MIKKCQYYLTDSEADIDLQMSQELEDQIDTLLVESTLLGKYLKEILFCQQEQIYLKIIVGDSMIQSKSIRLHFIPTNKNTAKLFKSITDTRICYNEIEIINEIKKLRNSLTTEPSKPKLKIIL